MATLKSEKLPLLVTNPKLSNEWNYDKNTPLLPSDITLGSSKKVWWKCLRGHSWLATPQHRNRGQGCPYCSNQRVLPGYNDLTTTNPDLAKEWDNERNGDLKPTDITRSSKKNVWWLGPCGHNWLASVDNRSKKNGTGCPICSSHMVLKGFNDLATVNPVLSREWNYEKNQGLENKNGLDISTPDKVLCSSNYKVWWKCKYGHEWQATINHRNAGRGCPYCLGSQTSMPEQGIAFYLSSCCEVYQRNIINGSEIDVYLPQYKIGIEYDGEFYHRNKQDLDQKKTNHFSALGIVLIRIIESSENKVKKNNIYYTYDSMGSNYEWALQSLCIVLSTLTDNQLFSHIDISVKRDFVSIRERFDLITKENSLLAKRPDVASEWNVEKNGKLEPDMFFVSSNQVVWWKCSLGHEWKSSINNRTGLNKNGCPFCSNKKVLSGYNDLATINPSLASEWNYEKNGELQPSKVLPKINKTVWWKCPKGHEWKANINSRAYGAGCPFCSGRNVILGENDLQTVFPRIAAEWNYERNKDFKPTEVTAYSHVKVWWKCKNNHEWKSMISNRTGVNQNGCPYCSGKAPKRVICVETGTIYNSIAEAKKESGARKISECCSGKRKMSGGYHWEFVDE